ncbi:MAG: UDP-N-acetylmuramoyl-L-alanyl-D-glutamate--2,6-diaminopimelate ligase [Magnetospirillum sp.]|nr:UDP-N-acetylmuramoyl-L-alanyl-D-glutamate--2,6-diaminopimelate ligase [Magnetospirillum sp.]
MTALPAGLTIAGLTADSRKVAPGFLFAALPGSRADGRTFIADALARGAVAILAPEGARIDAPGARIIADPDPRRRFALMAAEFHGLQPATMAAVTGTNGKTSTADFVRQIWGRLGHKAASIGTLGILAPGWDNAGGLTSPDPESLHAALAELARRGITHACMEASSHGLSQRRLDGVRLKAAAFTNLTRDHLDYHPDMADYGRAKLRLFAEVLPAGGTAVINADADFGPQAVAVASGRGQRVLTFGRAGSDLRLVDAAPQSHGQTLSIDVMGRSTRVRLPLAGTFQAANALAALGLAIACGADPQRAAVALETLEGVPGRLQKVAETASGATVYVDYAHTPDALETVLRALRPHAQGRLLVVFGCGGDRDPGKRPQMGAIARNLADEAIVTDDNPRGEDPAIIRRAILAACPDAAEIGDRAGAIREAVSRLRGGDVLVVAGKGHEQGQIAAGRVTPFDDAEQARLAVAEIDGDRP